MQKLDSLNQVAQFHQTFGAPILAEPTIPSKERCGLRVSLLAEELDELKEWLSTKNNRKVTFKVPKRGVKLKELKLANRNAKLLLNEWMLNLEKRKDYIPKLLSELQDILTLSKPPRLIEAFDISHFGGTDTVASMVVFKDGKPYKSGYRKYNINMVSINLPEWWNW